MSFLTSDQIDIIIHTKLIPLQTKIKHFIHLSEGNNHWVVSPQVLKEVAKELEEIKLSLMEGDIDI